MVATVPIPHASRSTLDAGLPATLMPDTTFLAWPFFDDGHRALAHDLDAWAVDALPGVDHGGNVDATCRALARMLGESGWLRWAVPAAYGGERESLDVRALCLARETLARHDGMA